MALNTLGERENAPGASRRESAHIKREFVSAARELVAKKRKLGRVLARNARVDNQHADLAHRTDQLKKPAYQYRDSARKGFREANVIFAEVDGLEEQIKSNKWGARKDSAIAFIQTAGAKIGLR